MTIIVLPAILNWDSFLRKHLSIIQHWWLGAEPLPEPMITWNMVDVWYSRLQFDRWMWRFLERNGNFFIFSMTISVRKVFSWSVWCELAHTTALSLLSMALRHFSRSWLRTTYRLHYSSVIMRAMASQITGVLMVCWIVCSCADQRKLKNSASLAFVRGIHRWLVNSPHNGPVTRKMFPLDDVIMVYTPTWCHMLNDSPNGILYPFLGVYAMPIGDVIPHENNCRCNIVNVIYHIDFRMHRDIWL